MPVDSRADRRRNVLSNVLEPSGNSPRRNGSRGERWGQSFAPSPPIVADAPRGQPGAVGGGRPATNQFSTRWYSSGTRSTSQSVKPPSNVSRTPSQHSMASPQVSCGWSGTAATAPNSTIPPWVTTRACADSGLARRCFAKRWPSPGQTSRRGLQRARLRRRRRTGAASRSQTLTGLGRGTLPSRRPRIPSLWPFRRPAGADWSRPG